MTCSSSVGLIIRCNITPRHSSKVSYEDKLSVVILMKGDMVGRTGDAWRWLQAKFHYAIWSQTGSKLMLVRC